MFQLTYVEQDLLLNMVIMVMNALKFYKSFFYNNHKLILLTDLLIYSKNVRINQLLKK